MFLGRILRATDGAEGNGGITPADNGQGAAGDKGPDLVKAVEGLIARHGDSTAALRVLLGENHGYRDKIRELTGKLPTEGSRVLQGEDARQWDSYRQLGTPSDLKKSLDAGKQYEAEAGGFRRAALLRDAAEVSGFKPSVLSLAARDLEIEIEEQKGKDGKPVRVAVVKGEGDTRIALKDYAEANWGDFLPSLRAAEERPIGTPRAGSPQRPVTTTTPQGGGNGTTTTPARRRPSF